MLRRILSFPTRKLAVAIAWCCAAALTAVSPSATAETVTHAVTEFGEPGYPADFEHFAYADPNAPKGGVLTLSTVGTFDTLNALPIGEPPRSLGLLHDSLMVQSQDETGVYYGLLAESVRYPDDAAWAEFTLRPEARFHDGTPITAADVVWSFEAVRTHGNPFLRSFYDDIVAASAVDTHRVRFDFATTGTLKPLVQIAGLSVLPRHWWEAEGRDIARGTLELPLGSGPYRLVSAEQGRTLVWERVEDYWGADLPVNRGLWNFDRIRYDYYRDRDAEFEAFKAGASDFRQEFTSLFWATGYDIPAVAEGRLVKLTLPAESPRGLQGFFFNTRRPPFDDIRVREALGWLYDFEWVQRTLFFGFYERMTSHFNARGYSQSGVAEGLEREILERFRGRIPDAVIDEPFTLPVTDGSGQMRAHIRRAIDLLAEAGWEQRDGRMVNAETGERLGFEILLSSMVMERLTQPWVDRLRQIGIDARLRTVDTAQFQARMDTFNFDVVSFAFTFFPPPGQELRSYYGSAAASVPGSANLMGVADPVVDALISLIVAAPDLETKQAATRALDRVLLWGRYAVPHWRNTDVWIAYWNRFGFPERQPTRDFGYGNGIAFQPTWWIDPARDVAAGTGG